MFDPGLQQTTRKTARSGAVSLSAIVAAISGTLLICSCGGSGGRQSVEGTVALDGKLLEKGQITFVPEPGTPGPTAGAEIGGGKFAIPASGGPLAGKFRVEITASRPGGKKVADRFTGKPVDAYEQFIPARYNTESQLTADVKADVENRFEFKVDSK
jgi:hypothetical protein